MYIITEDTPNPEVKKFIPHISIMGSDPSMEFKTKEEAIVSPLAEELFNLGFVKGVFFGGDFISVTKNEDKIWDDIRLDIVDVITENFITHKPLFKEKIDKGQVDCALEDQIIVDQIIDILETKVRPAVAQDGGDIVFKSYRQGVVSVVLKGACSGCPSSTVTLKSGIENMLKHYIPEVTEVVSVL